MAEIFETLSTYIDRIERYEGQFDDRDIVISTDLNNDILVDGDDDDIRKEPVLWRLYEHNMFYMVTVPAGKHIETHRHDESIFRFIAKGSLLLNKEHTITSGMWFVVKADTPYEIETKEGYTSLAGYTSICRTRRMATGLHLIEEKP
ncbi:MAG: hypothetical protein HOL37_10545 [Rhodospirillaceae bacterium]|jgi:hypothetical protein|nr:hypothetical protein [Rhodospirillaceae bacterium]MBT4219562.1 hypothetical protein [Rhodospirillaceae bacterium]MBT4463889.1 hypothetical protein [Rhodospirillaceae bacterium]MBT5013363.1 hypothetical protein [Rhodospirillaceae bacterium]MBT5309763.1 hypothetical protein [Rhodospirillaceae bacterium]